MSTPIKIKDNNFQMGSRHEDLADEDEERDMFGEEKLTTRTRETTYGSDFWKQQFKTAEIEVGLRN